MRFLASLSMVLFLCVCSCSGDTSSLMSVWNDAGSAAGGQAGQGSGGQGGQGGQPPSGGAGGGMGGVSGGSLVVPGGVRDLATTQCIVASGGSCPVPSDYLTCWEGNCWANLTACYYSDGFSMAAGGDCQNYANCMLACPCNGNRSTCEDGCYQNYASTNPMCSNCLFNLAGCASKYGCPMSGACVLPAGSAAGGAAGAVAGGYGGAAAGYGGVSGGQGGLKGSGGAVGAGGASGGGSTIAPPPVTVVDAGPAKVDSYPSGTVDVAPYRIDGASFITPDVAPFSDARPMRPDGFSE